MNTNAILKTLKVRVKDNRKNILNRMAFDVNQVWNAVNAETSEFCSIPIPEVGYVFNNISAFDLQKQFKGIRQERGMLIGAGTVQEVIAVHGKARKQFKKSKLKWRTSGGARRSLGYVPFKSGAVKLVNGQIRFCGYFFKVWDSYGLAKYDFRSGSFSQDARGRWYFNVVVTVKPEKSTGTQSVGIDLGCKAAATDSNGDGVTGREYRKLEKELGIAQRAKNKNRVKAIHAKIKNRRQDSLHKYSRKLVNENAAIFVGNVSSKGLVKTKMAKSVLDAGWGSLKTMLEYKCAHAGIVFEEINEAYTTVTCSCCKKRTGPSGPEGLRIREWVCTECGTQHDRDINAGRNILALGHERLAVGIPSV